MLSMSKSFEKKKTREQHIEEVVVDLEKDKFSASSSKKKTIEKYVSSKTIQKYVGLLKLTKQEYQKLFQESKLLKERINSIEKEKLGNKSARKDNIR